MQTKSVLTALSFTMLFSSSVFSMGPRLGGKVLASVSCLGLVATTGIIYDRHRQQKLEPKKAAAEQEKRRIRNAKEKRIATLRSQLPQAVIGEIEKHMEKKHGRNFWHDWTANDVLPEPRMKKAVNTEIEREVHKRKLMLIRDMSKHRVNTEKS